CDLRLSRVLMTIGIFILLVERPLAPDGRCAPFFPVAVLSLSLSSLGVARERGELRECREMRGGREESCFSYVQFQFTIHTYIHIYPDIKIFHKTRFRRDAVWRQRAL
ncbi:hypothetical protein PFISCL1PPCAC_25768, partial [Pristionchus fissidentatus]